MEKVSGSFSRFLYMPDLEAMKMIESTCKKSFTDIAPAGDDPQCYPPLEDKNRESFSIKEILTVEENRSGAFAYSFFMET